VATQHSPTGTDPAPPDDGGRLLAAARAGDHGAFERLVGPRRRELHAHCYRMLGSLQDAEDALQETLLAAWRGLGGFEGRSSLRTWLYRIATNASLRLAERRPRRVLSADDGPAWIDVHDLGDFREDDLRWLDPYPASPSMDPAERYDRRENVEVAFVAALQRLPATQRAVLILREVLEFPAAEVAEALDTTVAAVNSALQRARRTVGDGIVAGPQAAELRALGERGSRDLVAAFVSAWERADVDAVVAMLAEDARFTMPPFPAWFHGKADIGRFLSDRAFENRWRARPVAASGQLALALYICPPDADRFGLGSITVLSLRDGLIAELDAWLAPATHRWFDLPEEWVDDPHDAAR
jgi:RNA polymerase sigma-70 factor (ECF subfamily)